MCLRVEKKLLVPPRKQVRMRLRGENLKKLLVPPRRQVRMCLRGEKNLPVPPCKQVRMDVCELKNSYLYHLANKSGCVCEVVQVTFFYFKLLIWLANITELC
jgi:hypothetical protein